MLDERWVFHKDVTPGSGGKGVTRRVLAYSKDLMCVENTFEEGAGRGHHAEAERCGARLRVQKGGDSSGHF